MYVELYLAYILICGYEGKCEKFYDTTGMATSISDCHKRIQHMWDRTRNNPKFVESALDQKFSFVEEPRGFCILVGTDYADLEIIEVKYNL